MRQRLLLLVLSVLCLAGCAHKENDHSRNQQSAQGLLAKQAAVYMTPASAEAAIKQNPNNAIAHQRLGEDLAGHDPAGAIQNLRIASQLEPANRQVQFELAYELERSNQTGQALVIYRKLVQGNDGWASAAKRHLAKLKG